MVATRFNPNAYLSRHQTCEAALLVVDIKLCNEEAMFLYRGVKPPAKIEYAWQTIRTALFLCPDHAKRIMTDFAWHIQSGDVQLRRMDVERFTVLCTNCLSASRIEVLGKNLVTLPDAYCPRCGAKGSLKNDPERDWKELFRERYYDMDERLLDLLFAQWTEDEQKRFPRFAEFVEFSVNDILSEPDE